MFAGTGYLSNGQVGLLLKDAEAGIVLPALLADRPYAGWAAGTSIRPGINGLSEIAATAHFPLPWKDQIALGVQHTGIEGYSEQRISISYARKILNKLNAGLQFDVNRNSASEYADLYTPAFSVSLHAPLMKELSMSAFVYNPLGDVSALELSTTLRIGILYEPSDKVSVGLEAEKDWRHELRLKAGMHYKIHPRFSIRWGAGTEPTLFHAGITWSLLQRMGINGGWRYHPRLGNSLSAGISKMHTP
jgi:hypothetical protein